MAGASEDLILSVDVALLHQLVPPLLRDEDTRIQAATCLARISNREHARKCIAHREHHMFIWVPMTALGCSWILQLQAETVHQVDNCHWHPPLPQVLGSG